MPVDVRYSTWVLSSDFAVSAPETGAGAFDEAFKRVTVTTAEDDLASDAFASLSLRAAINSFSILRQRATARLCSLTVSEKKWPP